MDPTHWPSERVPVHDDGLGSLDVGVHVVESKNAIVMVDGKLA